MSSPSKRKIEDTQQPLPCVTLPKSKPESPTMSMPPAPESKRDQAKSWNLTFSRIVPLNPLSATNSTKWINWVKEKTSSMFLEDFLKTDTDEKGISQAESDTNDVIRKVLTAWMLEHMDISNHDQFKAKITQYTESGPEVLSLPSKLFSAIEKHYIDRSSLNQLIQRNALDQMKQGAKENLLTYLDSYQNAIINLRESGSTIDDNELGQKLLASLQPSHFRDAKDILKNGITAYDD
ncbi:hypothetical protein CROQUDRAFT_98677, partial [Cronartium quercuum f. sp. fusiforme G11]